MALIGGGVEDGRGVQFPAFTLADPGPFGLLE